MMMMIMVVVAVMVAGDMGAGVDIVVGGRGPGRE
jgi:hypothetical protein